MRRAASVMFVSLAMLGLASSAIADRDFRPRFSTNASGDIAIVGNTLETCQAAVADCVNARKGDGSALNNNGFVMERVDTSSTMFDSSSARLTLPAGARILFAGLYYGARTTAGTKGKAAPDATAGGLRTVDLKPPGTVGFERLSAAVDQSSEVTGAYAAFVDVTAQVRRSGSGVYTVANVQAATGEDRYAGWALVVAYEAFGDPPRNLTVFDGVQSVTQSKPALTIPVSGFQTPLSGPVRTKLGFVAYEGDRGLSGDSATLDGKAISDAVNPANNLFNSAISVDSRNFTDKTPDYVNQLGFDAKLIRIDGLLANGATSAKIALRTSSDQYLPHVITFATDLYAPVIRATKTVANLTHPTARRGEATRFATRSRTSTKASRRRQTSSLSTTCRPTPPIWRERCGPRARPGARPLRATPWATTSANTTRRSTPFASSSATARHQLAAATSRSAEHPATGRRSASTCGSIQTTQSTARSTTSRWRHSSRRR